MSYPQGDLLKNVIGNILAYYENPERKKQYMQYRVWKDVQCRKEMANVKRYYIIRFDGAWEVAIATDLKAVKRELDSKCIKYNDILNDHEFQREIEVGSINQNRCVGAMIAVGIGQWERFYAGIRAPYCEKRGQNAAGN